MGNGRLFISVYPCGRLHGSAFDMISGFQVLDTSPEREFKGFLSAVDFTLVV